MTPQELKFELQQQCKDLIKIRYETVNKTIANIEQAQIGRASCRERV